MAERLLLLLKGCQFCSVHVLAVDGDLRRADREERIARFDLLAFFDVQVGDHALAIREHLQRACRWCQKAGHGLLARELREAEKHDRDRHDRGKQPSQQLCRYRLQ